MFGIEKLDGVSLAGKEFWCGIIGGIFGVFISVFVLYLGTLGESIGLDSGVLYLRGSVSLLFSSIGVILGVGVIKNIRRVGVLMLVSGLFVLMTLVLFGIFTFVLFFIGGIIALRKRTRS